VLALALAAAPPAYAATVSGVQTDEYLEVTYAAAHVAPRADRARAG
jgi:hypothetical protein